MTEVIRKVIGDVRVECEQVLRLWVANRISAAVCFILQERVGYFIILNAYLLFTNLFSVWV